MSVSTTTTTTNNHTGSRIGAAKWVVQGGTQMYLFGGYVMNGNNQNIYADLWKYDTTANSAPAWNYLGGMMW